MIRLPTILAACLSSLAPIHWLTSTVPPADRPMARKVNRDSSCDPHATADTPEDEPQLPITSVSTVPYSVCSRLESRNGSVNQNTLEKIGPSVRLLCSWSCLMIDFPGISFPPRILYASFAVSPNRRKSWTGQQAFQPIILSSSLFPKHSSPSDEQEKYTRFSFCRQ